MRPTCLPGVQGAEAGVGLPIMAAQVSKVLKGYLLQLDFFFSPQEANSGVYFRLQEQFIPIHFQQSLRAIQLAFVSLNACDDFASGELQENPQVGSETSVPLFPFLLVRRMDFSGCALCSLLLPWIHQRLIFLLHVAPSHSK